MFERPSPNRVVLATLVVGGLLWGGFVTAAPPLGRLVAAAQNFKCPPDKKDPGSTDHRLMIRGFADPIELTNLPGPSLEGVTGTPYRDADGREVTPLHIKSLSVASVSSSVGAVSFWLDTSRPGKSAIWENEPGAGFPATQEMQFHFFVSLEALPGKVFRSVNPATMRSDSVMAFPPTKGTFYQMAEPVELEDAETGLPMGHVLSGSFTMG
jgi:hypothetical protein